MTSQDLTATSFLTSRLVSLVMVLAGVLFLFQPNWLGWSALTEVLDGSERLVGVGVGCAFLLLAAISFEKHALRVRCAELTETLNQLLYGKDYRNEREMIEAMLTSLESDEDSARTAAYKHLKRLTGQNFAEEPGVWRAWWQTNRRHFELRRTGAAEDPAADSDAS